MRSFPSDEMAEGWYVIGWSGDFQIGASVPLSYFGQDLVAFRGHSGELHVLDAHCPHLGAHLGYGGKVEGDCIRCPFHGWLYDSRGQNADIPYGELRPMPGVRLHAWETREVDGVALVYYSPSGGPAVHPAPASFARQDGPLWPLTAAMTRVWRNVPMAPLVFAENSVDAAHFKYIHHAAAVPEITDFGPGEGVFRGCVKLRFGGDRVSTWATPQGPVDGEVLTESWSVGIGWSRLIAFDDVVHSTGVTPVTPYTSDLFSTTWVPRLRGDGSELTEVIRDRWVNEQNSQVDADIVIWSHQSYVAKPPLERSEVAPTRAFRQWARQFYEAQHASSPS